MMSAAACLKKILCDAKAIAVSSAAEKIVMQVVMPSVSDGSLTPLEGEAFIREYIAADESYIADMDTISEKIERKLLGGPAPGP